MPHQTHQSEVSTTITDDHKPVNPAVNSGQVQPSIPVLTATVHRPKGTKIRLERSIDRLWIQCPNPGLCAAFRTRLLLLLGLLIVLAIGGCLQLELHYGSLPSLMQAVSASPTSAFKTLLIPMTGWMLVSLALLFAAMGLGYGIYMLRTPVCLHFNRNRLLVYKQLFGFKSHLLTQATSKVGQVFQRTIGRVGRTKYRGISLQIGTIDYSFGIGLSREECAWIVHEIQGWLQQR